MAHNLNFKDGKASMFSVKEVPWHGLGTIVPDCPTTREAIKLAQLDYEVGKAPLYPALGEPMEIEQVRLVSEAVKSNGKYYHSSLLPDNYCTYRKDNNVIFGLVGGRYEVVQNLECFEFFDNILFKGEAKFETAGALYNGRVTFITAKIPSFISIGKDDQIDKYFVLVNSHDGSYNITVIITPIRVVCHNTMTSALCSKNKITFKHTKNVRDRMDQTDKLLGLSYKYWGEFENTIKHLASIPITDEETVENVFNMFLSPKELQMVYDNNGNLNGISEISTRKKNLISTVHDVMYQAPGQDLHRGTALWFYNGITFYASNMLNNTEDERFEQFLHNDLSAKVFNSFIKTIV